MSHHGGGGFNAHGFGSNGQHAGPATVEHFGGKLEGLTVSGNVIGVGFYVNGYRHVTRHTDYRYGVSVGGWLNQVIG